MWLLGFRSGGRQVCFRSNNATRGREVPAGCNVVSRDDHERAVSRGPAIWATAIAIALVNIGLAALIVAAIGKPSFAPVWIGGVLLVRALPPARRRSAPCAGFSLTSGRVEPADPRPETRPM